MYELSLGSNERKLEIFTNNKDKEGSSNIVNYKSTTQLCKGSRGDSQQTTFPAPSPPQPYSKQATMARDNYNNSNCSKTLEQKQTHIT